MLTALLANERKDFKLPTTNARRSPRIFYDHLLVLSKRMKWQSVKKLHLEISALCNAACPNCARYPTSGYYELPSIKPTHVWTLEQTKQRFPAGSLSNIEFISFNGTVGDFVTNIEALEIIQYLHNNSSPMVRKLINTNGSARKEEWWRELATIPNLMVNFGIDGLGDTHDLYRRNTDWQRIIDNASAFIAAGGEAHWVMTIFQHNQHQVDDCAKLASNLGFKQFWARHTDRETVPARDRNRQTTHWIRPADNAPSMNLKVVTEQGIAHKEQQFLIKNLYQSGQIHNTKPLPSLENCDSLREHMIYVGGVWTVVPCCFLGVISFTREGDNRYDNLVKALAENNLTLEDLKASETQTVADIVDRGFDWIYNRITTPQALTACYNHCHPKDSAFRVSQSDMKLKYAKTAS